MPNGTVKNYNTSRGFGFITGDDGKEYFVHFSEIKEGDKLNEGDKVTFVAAEGERGPRAEKVETLSD